MPELDYRQIFPCENPTEEQREAITIKVTDILLHGNSSGIVKIINVPEADIASEKKRQNTLVTKVLNQIFGSVFSHPRRPPNETFNVTDDYGADKLRGKLHNYQTKHVLLPHCDHAHYRIIPRK